MKYFLIPAVLVAATLFTNNTMAQSKGKGKQAAAVVATPIPAAEPAAGPINMKDIDGKWKVDHVDIDSRPVEGEASKSTEGGSDDDFYDFAKGTLTSYLTGNSLAVPYNIVSHDVIYKLDGMADTLHVMSLSKTKAVITQKDTNDEGVTITTITLKR